MILNLSEIQNNLIWFANTVQEVTSSGGGNTGHNQIAGPDEIISSLLPNGFVVASHIIATIILILCITFLVWKPTKKYLKRRKEAILKDVIEANEQKQLANKNFEESKNVLLESKQTASKMISDALIESESIKNKVEKSTIKKIEHMQKEATEMIDKQKQEAMLGVDKKASLLAIDISEKILSKKIDEKESQKMIDDIILELKSQN